MTTNNVELGGNVFFEESTNLVVTNGTHDVYFVTTNYVATNFSPLLNWFQFEDCDAVNPILLEATNCNSYFGVSIMGDHVEGCVNGDWLCFQGVSFSNGYNLFRTCLAVPDSNAGQAVDIHLDSPTNPIVGTLIPVSTGGWTNWGEQWIQINGVGGTHNVYIVFRGQAGIGVGNFEWFQFANPLIMPPLRLQAAQYNNEAGIVNANTNISGCTNGDWVMFAGVNLGNRYSIFRTLLSADSKAGQVEVHIDNSTNNPIGTLTIASTGGLNTYAEQTNVLTNVTGIHDIYIVFKGGDGLGNFKWFQFEEPDTGIP